ncbi:phosphoglycolate phosphatase [Striga asiatica]|uniref:Phosphoglycolate phosphatase n=1 Tax=Striga asiatica TaxID=4170 RepID=A0A5A7QCD6_STRAF|nr:phosphoglycolate phosphatase [Striga asiatica]
MYRTMLSEKEYVRIKSEDPSGIDILHHIETWIPNKQKRAYEIIADFEKQGLDHLHIMLALPHRTEHSFIVPPASLLLAANPTAKASASVFLVFNPTTTAPTSAPAFTARRDAASTPRLHRRTAEPGPRPLTSLVACGKGAGAFTCLLDETGRYDSPPYKNVEYKPDYKVSSLVEVHKLLEKDFSLYPYSHK